MTASTKIIPKRHYTINDLAEMVAEMHACIDVGNAETKRIREDIQSHRIEVSEQFGDVRERVAKMEGRQESVAQRVGVDEKAQTQKPQWYPKPWQIIAGICGGVSGFAALYKLIVPMAEAFHSAVMASHG